MTFLELLLIVVLISFFIYLMKPFQKRLESRLYKIFRNKSKFNKKHPDIPLTPNDYTKKEKPTNE